MKSFISCIVSVISPPKAMGIQAPKMYTDCDGSSWGVFIKEGKGHTKDEEQGLSQYLSKL